MKVLLFLANAILVLFTALLTNSMLHVSYKEGSPVLAIVPLFSSVILFGMFLTKENKMITFRYILHIILLISTISFLLFTIFNTLYDGFSFFILIAVPFTCELFLFINFHKNQKSNSNSNETIENFEDDYQRY